MTVYGTYTDSDRAQLANLRNDQVGASNVDAPQMRLKYFRYGVLGYQVVSGVKVPKTPDPALTTIESTNAGPSDYYFQKDFQDADVTDDDLGTVTAVALLESGEANDDGSGSNPDFFECGFYDENDVMVAYFTFDGETKSAGKTIELTGQIPY